MEEPWRAKPAAPLLRLLSPGRQCRGIATQARVQVPSVRPQNDVGGIAPSAGSGALPGAVESGRADALALEGFGWLGGDFGRTGQDPGEQVKQVCSFVLGEGGQGQLSSA